MISKPSVAKYKYTLDSSKGVNNKQIATSPRELVAVIVTGGGADTVVGIYDSASGQVDTSEALFLGCNQGESTPFTPCQPVPFTKGIYVQIEQGGTPFNGKVSLIMN